MYLIFNIFFLYINKLKILILVSKFNFYFLNLLIFNFLNRLVLIGFIKNNIIIISIIGSLEVSFFFNIFFKKNIFDIYILLGFIIKNKTFHFELICLNIYLSLFRFYNILNIPFINSLLVFNNNFNFLSKLVKINNLNLKIFLKFLNLTFFLKKVVNLY